MARDGALRGVYIDEHRPDPELAAGPAGLCGRSGRSRGSRRSAAVTISEQLRAVRAKVGHDLLVLPASVVVVRDDAGAILLVDHIDTRRWGLPGGGVDPDEAPENAAVREVIEETGLEVEVTALLDVLGGPGFGVTYPNGDAVSYVTTIYEACVVGGTLRPDGEEVASVEWCALADLPARALGPLTTAALTRLGWLGPPTERPRWTGRLSASAPARRMG